MLGVGSGRGVPTDMRALARQSEDLSSGISFAT